MRTLLVGMGNPILSDDAIGVRLARELKPHLAGCADLDIVDECSVGGLNLLDVISGYDRVVVIDSVRTVDGVPGTWHQFTAEALRDTLHLRNVHDVNFATAIEFGRRLGLPLPDWRRIHVFAVEIQDDFTFSERMTPGLERALHACAIAILARVRALLDGEGEASGGCLEPRRPREPSSDARRRAGTRPTRLDNRALPLGSAEDR
jgi:hydrogenase maturation protease